MAGSNGIPVRLEITEILMSGTCPVEHKVGDSWVIENGIVPEGICAAAWNSIQPYVVSIRYGGKMPWSGEAKFSACCPDPGNPVVFTMEAIAEE